jgi:hypothetical protein
VIRLVPVPLEPEALLAASLRSCRPILCTRANGCTLAVCASVVRYSLAGHSDRTLQRIAFGRAEPHYASRTRRDDPDVQRYETKASDVRARADGSRHTTHRSRAARRGPPNGTLGVTRPSVPRPHLLRAGSTSRSPRSYSTPPTSHAWPTPARRDAACGTDLVPLGRRNDRTRQPTGSAEGLRAAHKLESRTCDRSPRVALPCLARLGYRRRRDGGRGFTPAYAACARRYFGEEQGREW